MSSNLEQTLGLEPGALAFLEKFPDEDVDRLRTLFDQAHVEQRKQVDQAIESGLQIVPKMLRKTVRKIFGDN